MRPSLLLFVELPAANQCHFYKFGKTPAGRQLPISPLLKYITIHRYDVFRAFGKLFRPKTVMLK